MTILLKACGGFYALLCVFSLVTGLLYALGRRELNPVELPDSFLRRYEDPEKRRRFAARMGWVTSGVGLVQGLTAWSIFRAGSRVLYGIAVGFTLFSIASVAFKLRGKVHPFPVLKCVAYVSILAVLIAARRAFV